MDALPLIEKVAREVCEEFEIETFDLPWFLAYRQSQCFEQLRSFDLAEVLYVGIVGTCDDPRPAAEELVDEAIDNKEEDQTVEDYIREALIDFLKPTHPLEKEY